MKYHLIFLLATLPLSSVACHQEELLNIVLIMADDQGWATWVITDTLISKPLIWMLWRIMQLFLPVLTQRARYVLPPLQA